jgi:hypothetical protein
MAHQCVSVPFGHRDLEYFASFRFSRAFEPSNMILRENFAKLVADGSQQLTEACNISFSLSAYIMLRGVDLNRNACLPRCNRSNSKSSHSTFATRLHFAYPTRSAFPCPVLGERPRAKFWNSPFHGSVSSLRTAVCEKNESPKSLNEDRLL